MATALKANYTVADKTVMATVVVGDAQIGVSRISLDTVEIGRGAITDLPIGNGQQIKTRSLEIKTVVSDVSDSTDTTSVTIKLHGGVAPQEFLLVEKVAQPGGAVVYRITITFI